MARKDGCGANSKLSTSKPRFAKFIVGKPVEDMTDLEKWAVFFWYAGNRKYRDAVNNVYIVI